MKKRNKRVLWSIRAVVLLIICVLTWMWANRTRTINLVGHDITLPEMESMTVQIVQFDSYSARTPTEMWEKGRIAAIVVDAGSNSVYQEGAELSLALDLAYPKPDIYLADGSRCEPDWEDLDLKQIGWENGQYLYVEFQRYADGYSEGNHFYNLVYPSYIQTVKNIGVKS